VKKAFSLPKAYRTSLGATLTIAAIDTDKFVLAQPITSDSVQLLEVTPNAPDKVRILTELAIPGGAKIQGIRISPDASTLAVLTEHEGNYAIQLWDLKRMNQLLAREAWMSAPLFHTGGHGSESSRVVKVRFDSAGLERLGADRHESFQLEPLEKGLRDLASRKALDDIEPGTEAARQTAELLNGIAKTSRDLGEPDWEKYFRERARTMDFTEKR
jgi:hypothetical protein